MVGSQIHTYNCELKKFNTLTMDEDSSMVDHVNHMALVVKDLSVTGNLVPNKMKVSTYFLVFLLHGT